MTEPGTTISRAAVAESVDHWRSIKDPRSSSAKALRKAEARGARDSAATAEAAADAGTVAQLDRRAGAVAATRVLTPARIVQGRATAAEMPVERGGYTQADVDDLARRVREDGR